ncbi:MAG: SUMF1/EgtB/PvdO family nonheme iron enzyme [Nitrospira sp.]|nr:SUMF1/EgtB/PvdO family nonheme iron enzyme [Nitrospira sp.]
MYPQGATKQGVMDMAGNVWEWCLNKHENPERLDTVPIDKGALRLVRGGPWDDIPVFLRASLRDRNYAGGRANDIGFRLVQDIT